MGNGSKAVCAVGNQCSIRQCFPLSKYRVTLHLSAQSGLGRPANIYKTKNNHTHTRLLIEAHIHTRGMNTAWRLTSERELQLELRSENVKLAWKNGGGYKALSWDARQSSSSDGFNKGGDLWDSQQDTACVCWWNYSMVVVYTQECLCTSNNTNLSFEINCCLVCLFNIICHF